MGMVTLALFFLFFSIEVPRWLICTAVALSIVVAAEIRKAVLRRAAARPSRRSGSPALVRCPASGACASIAVR